MSTPVHSPPLTPLEVITAKRAHLARLANESGAAGEQAALLTMEHWTSRPKGTALRLLLATLAETGVTIKASSFDALAAPEPLDFTEPDRLRRQIASVTFIEIKTANQARVQPGFAGFFFALTESEISAADQLGPRHRVALFNNLSGELLITSVPEIIARSRSMNWQLSVQL